MNRTSHHKGPKTEYEANVGRPITLVRLLVHRGVGLGKRAAGKGEVAEQEMTNENSR